MTDRANLEGQIAVVTGASRGIGKAITKELAAQGATIVINYNGSEAKADEVKHEIVEKGGCAQCMQCNVADYEGCEAFIKAVIEQFADTTGIRDLEQAAEHIAANALYQIEVEQKKKVVFDAEMVKELLD